MCKDILVISQFTFISRCVCVSDVGVLKKWLCKCRMNIFFYNHKELIFYRDNWRKWTFALFFFKKKPAFFLLSLTN